MKDSVTKSKSLKHSRPTLKTVIDNDYIVGVSEIDKENCKVILDKKSVGDDNILYVVGNIDDITNDICYNPSDISEVEGLDDGYGYGNWNGNGSDSGRWEGHGYWDDFGSGNDKGDNTNVKVVNCVVVHIIDGIPTLIDFVHGNFAKGYILEYDLNTNPCYIAKCGNYFAHSATIENAFKYAREKYEENIPLEERIASFNE